MKNAHSSKHGARLLDLFLDFFLFFFSKEKSESDSDFSQRSMNPKETEDLTPKTEDVSPKELEGRIFDFLQFFFCIFPTFFDPQRTSFE